MEDIEYLEEYEDFILPKTLNYSEEFPVNAIEGDLLDETCNDFNPELPSDGPECEDNISRCSSIPNPRTNKTNVVKILNTEVLRTPAQAQNYNKEATPTTSIIPITQHLQFRQSASFLDRITQNPVLQRLDKYKSVATVKPTLQRTKTFKLSSISPPFVPIDSKIQTISNVEYVPKRDLKVSNKVLEDDSLLDYAVEKHGVDDYNLEFNLDTADISDICSDSLNFSDDYNDDIFCLESLLSSGDMAKQKLKRKIIHDTDLEIDHKKSKYGSNFYSSKQMQKTAKHNVTENFPRKSSINQKLLKISDVNVEKKKNQISVEKRKMNSIGKKSKLVVKKNGKKFVFPDRSKFSLKNLNSSNNVEDETQASLTTKTVHMAPQIKINHHAGESNKDVVNYSCTVKNTPLKTPTATQESIKSSYNPGITTVNEAKNNDLEKVKEKDIVIFSSPKNMKRIDSETPIHQSGATPIKSTGLTFGHFSLKSIKPPSNLKIKEIIPLRLSGNKDENKLEDKESKTFIESEKNKLKEIIPKDSVLRHSENKDENKLEDKESKTFVESEKFLGTSEKDNVVASPLQKIEPLPNLFATCDKGKESHEHNELVSNSNNRGKLLETLEHVLDSSIGRNDGSPEKTTNKTSNNKKESANVENINHLDLREQNVEKFSKEQIFSKASNTIQKVNDIVCPMDKSLKSISNDSVSKRFPTKEKCLETQSNDLDSSFGTNKRSVEETVEIMPRNIIENWNSSKVNEINSSTQKNSLKTNDPNKEELLQKLENVLYSSISTNFSSISMDKAVKKSLNKKGENKYPKENNDADRVAAESIENSCKDKFVLETSLPNTSLNEEAVHNKEPILAYIFEPRGFDIRLSKNIVAKLLKSAKTSTNPIVPKILDETKNSSKPDILMPQNFVLDSTSEHSPLKNSRRFSTESAETTGTKNKTKKGRKKKTIQPIASVESSIKTFPLMPDSTENIISNLPSPTDGINFEDEKKGTQNLPSGLAKERVLLPQPPNLKNDDSKQRPPNEIPSDVKEVGAQKLPCILVSESNVSALPTSTESQSTDLEKKKKGIALLKKYTRQTVLKSKENSQPKPNMVSANVKEKEASSRKELTKISTPVALADNCISYQATIQLKSTKSLCDIEIVEPKKELNDETVVPQFRPTNLLANDSFLNKIKLNESPDTSINKTCTDLNVCPSSIDRFGNEHISPKFTIFELPAYIVMKTKIITRKDLETNKTLNPPVIKQQVDTESENSTTESVVKTERPVFNSVCAQINSLLEQNANYLKFASGSERLTRMNDVLGDYSLSVEDANCTLKFLQSYLSSGSRDKAIKTRGQQFIPIYDSQKKIIGYRKRTIHVKPLSSRRSSRRTTKVNAQSNISVTTMNINRNAHLVENNPELPPKIEPDLLDVGESELIVPDTSPANDICIKNEEDHME